MQNIVCIQYIMQHNIWYYFTVFVFIKLKKHVTERAPNVELVEAVGFKGGFE